MIFKFQNRLQRHVCFLIHASIIPALYSNLSRALIRNVSAVLLLCVTLGVINLAPFSPFSRHMPYKLMRFHSLYFCILLYASCNYLIRIAKTFERKKMNSWAISIAFSPPSLKRVDITNLDVLQLPSITKRQRENFNWIRYHY